MVNTWHDISAGEKAPNVVNVIIEIPSGSRDKYELDKETGLIKLDRVLETSFGYPGNYGFIPQTLCDDNDPLDVIILTHSSLHPGILAKVRPVGMLDMMDEGEKDEKILAVPADDKRFNEIKDLRHVPKGFLDEIEHFFKRYKEVKGSEVKVGKWGNARKAKAFIKKSMKIYGDRFK